MIDRTEEIEDYIMELYDLRFEQKNINIDVQIERIAENQYFIQGKYKPPYYKLEFIPESVTCGSWTEESIQFPTKGESHFKQVLITPERECKTMIHFNYKIDIVYTGRLQPKVNSIIETSRKRLGLDWIVTEVYKELNEITGYDKWRSIFFISNKEDYKEICDYIKNDEYSVRSNSFFNKSPGSFSNNTRKQIGMIIQSPPLRTMNYYY